MKLRRGFRVMSLEKHRAIASLGGKAAHQQGTAHEWTSEEAAAAGRKGGKVKRSK
jgi:general stress protein YciG